MADERKADVEVAGLGRNSQFNLYWAGQACSVFGNSFGTLAVPLLVLDATGSLVQMGIVTGVYGVFRLVAGLLAGPVVDALDRKKLMIFCDVARALTYAAIPVVWLFSPQVWLLYVTAAVGATLSFTFQVAHVSLVNQLVDPTQLVAANSRLETTNSLSFIIGPLAAGAICAAIGAQNAIAVDAVSFLGSALAIRQLRVSMAVDENDPSDPYAPVRGQTWWQSFTEGLRFLWQHQTLRWLMNLLTIFTVVTASAENILIFWLQKVLDVGSTATGVIFGISSIGGLVAAVLAPTLRRRAGFAVCWFGSYALVILAISSVRFATHPWSVAVIAVVFVFGTTLAGICSMSLRQQVTPPKLLGRVTASFWTSTTSLAPLGGLALTSACAKFGVPEVLLPVGLVCLVLLAVGLTTPLRRREHV